MEPVGAGSHRVTGELPDGPLVWSGPQPQLLGGEITERVDDEALVVGPTFVEDLRSGRRPVRHARMVGAPLPQVTSGRESRSAHRDRVASCACQETTWSSS